MIKAKWLSVMDHITDVHEFDNDLFSACEHGDLGVRTWLEPGNYSKFLTSVNM